MFLVTGATGNVGGELVRALAEAGQQVRALTRSGSAKPLPDGVALDIRVEPGALRIRVDADKDVEGDESQENQQSRRSLPPSPGVNGGHPASEGEDRP